MSEPKLISPLLDGFVMGDPISSHNGVYCCPAMQTSSGSKHIVKVISVPASQTKLDALLLAGAFQSNVTALLYFKELADGIVEEAALLQRLSRLEGFVSYNNWQIVSMEDGDTGFDVYLSGAYRPTLERQLRKDTMTHLGAVNLGLDLCAALAVCRRLGYLYVDLKPENVAICQDNEYRISDLGFLPLSSLNYASLPERYLSRYTPPEIADASSALNTTMDVYAAGLILYQVYNGGVLPFTGRAPAEPLSAPQYADSEMAQIILKACDPNPEVRWQDPLQMGQALVSYMQSHSVNDTPIIVPPAPVMPEVLAEAPAQEVPEEPSTNEILAEVDQALDAVGVTAEEPAGEVQESSEEPDAPAPAEEAAAAEPEDPEIAEAEDLTDQNDTQVDEDTDVPAEETDPQPAEDAELAAEATAIAQELGVSEEVSHILAQADSLIAHETPDPVVAPEPVEIPIPAPIVPEPEEPEDAVEEAASEEPAPEETPQEPEIAEDEDTFIDDLPAPENRKRGRGWLAALICLVFLAGAAFGGYLFYENYYLQTIQAISLEGQEDRLTVLLDSDIDDSLLTVFCTDTYGNTLKQSVSGKKAVFRDLNPGTRYKISVSISGFHKLIGATTSVHTTAEQTTLSNLTAVTGAEDGSVILSFTVQGPENSQWKVNYSAQGEETKTVPFTGHMITITGLTVGKEYTFQLEPATGLYVVGTDTIKHTASKIILAEELTIQGFRDSSLIAAWEVPEGVRVENWVIRCYNDKGYDKTITVNEPKAVFEKLDVSAAYTVEVTAAGMTQSARTYVSANSVTVGEIQFDFSDRTQLSVNWAFEGSAPAGGWLLLYSVDGSEEQQVVQCTENKGMISPVIPGSSYTITIQPANGSTVFGGSTVYQAPAAQAFSGYLVTAADMEFRMCRTPEDPQWNRDDVKKYKTSFSPDESASFAVTLHHEYNTSSDIIITLFVIRDSEGSIIHTATQSRTWTSMWKRGFGRFNVPVLPENAGNYSMEIYLNGALAHTQEFSVTD